MKSGLPNNEDRDRRLEENDPLWSLLGHVPPAEPDAWFTARTLARCRNAEPAVERPIVMLGRLWRLTLGMGMSVGLALFLMAQVRTEVPPEPADATQQKSVQEAFEIMASLSPDADSSSSSSTSTWQDSSL